MPSGRDSLRRNRFAPDDSFILPRPATSVPATWPYRLPPRYGYQRQFTSSFNVGPDGALFILVRAQPGDTVLATKPRTYFIDKFDADGSFDSRVQLDGPSDDFDPQNFAVFADGRFLVLGITRNDAKEQAVGICGDSHGNFLFIESNPKSQLEIDKYSAN